jgi:exonuclease VII small subunit
MRICDTHLKSAEGKLKQLLKGENGEFIEKILGSTPDALSEEVSSDD